MVAAVSVNDRMLAGQLVGFSGHTGNSTELHLHIDVSRGCCVIPPNWNDLPIGETIPLSFKNAKAAQIGARPMNSGRVLRRGVRYEAVYI